MPHKNIKHIFFDLDHTLWDLDLNSELAFKKCFDQYKINVNFDVFMQLYTPINEAYWRLYGEEKITKEELKYKRFRDTFDLLNYTIDDDLIHFLSDEYLKLLPTYNHLHDGTLEILEYLFPNFKMHIITNGFNEVSFRKLENSGIAKYFDKVITSENAGAKKPDAQVFNYALTEANAFPYNSMMIGDNLDVDVKGALSVGMKAIYYNYNDYPIDNDDIESIKHLLEIKQLL